MIAIIGSNGFIGSKLVEFYKAKGEHVVEYSSKSDNFVDQSANLVPNFEVIKNSETVIYLSQSPNYRNFPEKYNELIKINSLLPFEVARHSIIAQAKKFIYFSTGSVYKPSLLPLDESSDLNRESSYPLSKIHGEENLKILSKDIQICCVRPFGVYGSGQKNMLVPNLISSIKEGREIFIDRPEGGNIADGLNISLSYVGDLVSTIDQLVRCDELPFELNLAGEESYSLLEIVTEIGSLLKCKPNIVIRNERRQGNLIADTSKLKKFARLERTTLRDGLIKTLEVLN